MIVALVIITVLIIAAGLGALIVKNLTEICQPNEVLVISGATRRVGNRRLGYRVIQGGRAMRVPLFERVDRLDLTNMIIDLRIRGAYSRGGIPLEVNGVANVKIASEEPTIGNAIIRFLGVSRANIKAVVRETLEGNLRGVLSQLTPEEVNQDRVKFAENLLQEADADLRRMGLVLDMMKIQHVSDEVGYLDSIGRRQSAALQMRSRIAEAENQSAAVVRNAQNMEEKETAQLEAYERTVRASAAKALLDARTLKDALMAEEDAKVTAAVAKARAELDVQRARVEQVRMMLEADRIRPAEARRDEMIATARGAAAKIVEEGRATAVSISELSAAWKRGGHCARQITVAQQLDTLVEHLMSTVDSVPIDSVTQIDAGLAREGGTNLAVKGILASEQLKRTIGVDIPGLINGFNQSRVDG